MVFVFLGLSMMTSWVYVLGGGESTDIEFYGKLSRVVQVLYKYRYQVIVFKCRWFNTNPHRQGNVKRDYGVLLVDTTRTWYDNDPYILASMGKQVFYVDDPKAGRGWKVVQRIKHRNVYAILDWDPSSDGDDINVAVQRLESSIEIGTEILWDNNLVQEPFQIPRVASFEISINSISIHLGDLTRYNPPEAVNNDDDIPNDEEEWDIEDDDTDDSESYYSSDDD